MKIMIFGRPGSGKSTFATKLNKKTNIPIYHLDKYFFIDNWVERNYQDFLNIQQNFVNKDQWIIDGNSTKSLEIRYAKADIAIYFNLPRLICLYRVFKRYFLNKEEFDDRAPNCPEKIDFKFIKYIWTFNKRVNKQIKKLKQKYPQVKFYTIKCDLDAEKAHNKIVSLLKSN